MLGSYAKRARALLLFTAGVLPVSGAAQAQSGSSVPFCEISGTVNPRAHAAVSVYWLVDIDGYYDDALVLDVDLYIKPSRTSPSITRTSGDNAGEMMLHFYHEFDGSSSDNEPIDLDGVQVVHPFQVDYTQPAAATAYDVNVMVEGNSRTASTGSTSRNVDITVGSWGVPLNTFTQDPQVTFTKQDGAITPTTLTYSRADINAAIGEAEFLSETLSKRAENGSCDPEVVETGCFLTTATCEAVGLDDDCWELTTLRRFRDGWLAHQPGGPEDIARYYREAPEIAQRLKANPHALLKLYWTRIVPSALAAQIGANRLARAI